MNYTTASFENGKFHTLDLSSLRELKKSLGDQLKTSATTFVLSENMYDYFLNNIDPPDHNSVFTLANMFASCKIMVDKHLKSNEWLALNCYGEIIAGELTKQDKGEHNDTSV